MIALLLAQAAAAWSPPAQATWPASEAMPSIRVAVEPIAATMAGNVDIDVRLAAAGDGVAVSPFLQATRGIAFEVRGADGAVIVAKRAMVFSPPPPPLAVAELTPVTATRPMVVHVREAAAALFPRPGVQVIRAIVTLFDFPAGAGRRAYLSSLPVTITVTR